MSGSFHIFPATYSAPGNRPTMVPLPVTFYVTEEAFEDADALPHARLAELLARDLALAVEHYREHPEQTREAKHT
jgi:hypothetical protein